jgi:hypothetical protein
MSLKRPTPGPGRFQWNAGGWFGSQLGGTAWMLVGTAILVPQAPGLAAWWAACFAAANAVGAGLWLRRDRVRPYPALQSLLAACGLAGLFAVSVLHRFRPDDIRLGLSWQQGRFALDAPQGGTLNHIYAALLLGVPALMAWFAVMEWAGLREACGGGSANSWPTDRSTS